MDAERSEADEQVRRIEGHDFPEGLWYQAAEHLWLRPGEPDGSGRRLVTVGLDALGVLALGEVVYAELGERGLDVRAGQALGSLEAEKMVRPVLAPVSGTVVEVNDELQAAPRRLNTDPYGGGWLVRIAAGAWDLEATDFLRAPGDVEAWVRQELSEHEDRR
ncbi:MAG: glycine cleavage system protein H [Candidatus Rokubacteria bacterium]|nr:glycine cleavage system protein H [Candidatus Rokubacteria bacterium]